MKLSAFKSFTPFLRIKVGMSGVRSKRFPAGSMCSAAVLISIAVIVGFTLTRRQASALALQTPAEVTISSEAFHITAADGAKSIGQLISEQGLGSPLPDNRFITGFHFIVDSQYDDLIVTRIECNNPPGFELGIKAGQNIRFKAPRSIMPVSEAVNHYYIRTPGTCNVLVYMESYPFNETVSPDIYAKPLRITAADGVKSIAQLISQQHPGATLPENAISSFQFVVDSRNNALEFTQIEDQPAGWTWSILPGQNKLIANPETSAPPATALENWHVRTQGTCNFILILDSGFLEVIFPTPTPTPTICIPLQCIPEKVFDNKLCKCVPRP